METDQHWYLGSKHGNSLKSEQLRLTICWGNHVMKSLRNRQKTDSKQTERARLSQGSSCLFISRTLKTVFISSFLETLFSFWPRWKTRWGRGTTEGDFYRLNSSFITTEDVKLCVDCSAERNCGTESSPFLLKKMIQTKKRNTEATFSWTLRESEQVSSWLTAAHFLLTFDPRHCGPSMDEQTACGWKVLKKRTMCWTPPHSSSWWWGNNSNNFFLTASKPSDWTQTHMEATKQAESSDRRRWCLTHIHSSRETVRNGESRVM